MVRFLARSVPALVLMLAGAASAGGSPPSIDDLDGATFAFRAVGSEYDLAGGQGPFDVTITCTLYKVSPTVVRFDSIFGGMFLFAQYVDGFLLQGIAFDSGAPPEAAGWMYAEVSGQPGRLKFKGLLGRYDAPPNFQVLQILKLSGKQITP